MGSTGQVVVEDSKAGVDSMVPEEALDAVCSEFEGRMVVGRGSACWGCTGVAVVAIPSLDLYEGFCSNKNFMIMLRFKFFLEVKF